MFDIVSLGHFSIDLIHLPSRTLPYKILGGSVTYVSLAAKRLGANVALISKVGFDFPKAYLWWLEQEGISLLNVNRVENAPTTSFELFYTQDLCERALKLKAKAPQITIDDLPPFQAKIVHAAPIVDELPIEMLEIIRKRADIISLDPQGLMRNIDEQGKVTLKALPDKKLLDIIDIYKSSQIEIQVATGVSDTELAIKEIHNHGVKIVIVTLGEKGALVSTEGNIVEISAYKTQKTVDPTGAGDAFMGGFLTEYARERNLLQCACIGSAVASLVVEGVGPTSFGSLNEIYERASALYGKEIKE